MKRLFTFLFIYLIPFFTEGCYSLPFILVTRVGLLHLIPGYLEEASAACLFFMFSYSILNSFDTHVSVLAAHTRLPPDLDISDSGQKPSDSSEDETDSLSFRGFPMAAPQNYCTSNYSTSSGRTSRHPERLPQIRQSLQGRYLRLQ